MATDYQNVFEFIRDAIFSHDGTFREPVHATLDFEQGMRLALINTWPNVVRHGCNFHYCQAIRRHARSIESLSASLTGGTKHHFILVMFMRLSMLPLDKIEIGYHALLSFIRDQNLKNDFSSFISYFNRTWLVRFPKETWCVNGLNRRTNNNIEGYNNRIKISIPLNPSPWKFLEGLNDLAHDAITSFDADKLRNTQPPPDRSTLTSLLNDAMDELNRGVIDELQFLKKMANGD